MIKQEIGESMEENKEQNTVKYIGNLFETSNLSHEMGEKIGETIVTLWLTKNYFFVYNKFVDAEGVDLVATYKSDINSPPPGPMRINSPYWEIQVKYSKKYKDGYKFNIQPFGEYRNTYIFFFVGENDDMFENIFVIPSPDLNEIIKKTSYNKIARIFKKSEKWFLSVNNSKIDITDKRGNISFMSRIASRD